MIHLRLLTLVSFLLSATTHAELEWITVWNGRDLSEWSTWLHKPDSGSNVPGLSREPDGKYQAPIGSDRDPLGVFRIVEEDGKLDIRIRGIERSTPMNSI